MRKTFILFLAGLILSARSVFAQLKLGSSADTVSSGQLLELNALGNRGGLKVASVALDSATDVTTVNIAAGKESAGTVIWNTSQTNIGRNDVVPGFYVWDGGKWALLQTAPTPNARLSVVESTEGDVVKIAIIVAGQSNTHTGGGEIILPPDFARKGMLQLGRGTENFAEIPLTFYGVHHHTPLADKGSFASMFCYYYYDYLKTQYPGKTIKLLLIPAGAGGSGWTDSQYPANSWRTEAAYFKDLVKRIKWAKGAGYQIDAFLWHQGEADAYYLTPNYKDILSNFIQSVREHIANSSLPFILGQMASSWVAGDSRRGAYQTIINEVTNQIPYTYTVSATGLPIMSDGIHFTAAAQYELGKRYHDGLATAKANAAPANYAVPAASEYLILNHNSGGGTYFGNIFDAMRRDEGSPGSVLHSKLGDIWKYKNADGYYHFKLEVVSGGSLTGKIFEWKQRYNPFGISETYFEERGDKSIVSNGIGLDTTANGQGFASLVCMEPKQGSGIPALFGADIRRTTANTWWFPIGQTTNFSNSIPLVDPVAVTHIRLYAIKD